MSIYNNHGYAIARCAIDKLAAAVRLALGAFLMEFSDNAELVDNLFDMCILLKEGE